MNPRIARAAVHAIFSQIRVGSLVVVENGHRRVYGTGAPAATAQVHSPEAWAMLLMRQPGSGRVVLGRPVGFA